MAENIAIKVDGNIALAEKLEVLILNILNTSAGDSVKETALSILKEAFPYPKHVSISNVHVEQTSQPGQAHYGVGQTDDTSQDTNQDNLDEEEDY